MRSKVKLAPLEPFVRVRFWDHAVVPPLLQGHLGASQGTTQDGHEMVLLNAWVGQALITAPRHWVTPLSASSAARVNYYHGRPMETNYSRELGTFDQAVRQMKHALGMADDRALPLAIWLAKDFSEVAAHGRSFLPETELQKAWYDAVAASRQLTKKAYAWMVAE